MKIVHSSGEAFDTPADLSLEIERVNPFFNDYGEQSLPVMLPSTARNRRLMGYADDPAMADKTSQRVDAAIREGVFSFPARMATLSANRKTGIEASFYLNTGAFYERMTDVSLSDVFKDETVDFWSVSGAVDYCERLLKTPSSEFACFEVCAGGKRLNRYEESAFYHAVERTEMVDEVEVRIPAGFYITPFVKVMYVLRRILQYFGYTLRDNFFTETEPFASMVFLNNTVDTLLKGRIDYVQLLPDAMVSTILKVFRNRFCCEFVPDEAAKAVDIVLFRDLVHSTPSVDLSACVIDAVTVQPPEGFRQLKLTCEHPREEHRETSDPSTEAFTLLDLLNKYPEADLDLRTGELSRTGFRGIYSVRQVLGHISQDYYAGGLLKVEEKSSPDEAVRMEYHAKANMQDSERLSVVMNRFRSLNTSIVTDATETESSETLEDESADTELRPVLCFHFSEDGIRRGTVYNYALDGSRLWDYTLSYHGADGLYERFWRAYDNCLRNSFIGVEAQLLLTDSLKTSLSPVLPVSIGGQSLLPNIVGYSVAKGQEAMSATFLTTRMYAPLSEAVSESERFEGVTNKYAWAVHSEGRPDEDWSIRFLEERPVLYYDAPTAAEYAAGGRYHEREYACLFVSKEDIDGRVDEFEGVLTVWLEAELNV